MVKSHLNQNMVKSHLNQNMVKSHLNQNKSNGKLADIEYALTSLDLHDPDVLEAHPGSQGGADQDTEDHHYLLPENRNWLKNDNVFSSS